jgi:hypothetical protein
MGSRAGLVLALVTAAPASASVRSGLEVGASYSTFARGSDSGPYVSDGTWHPSVGLVLEADLSRDVLVRPGLRWVRGGAQTSARHEYFEDSNVIRESWLAMELQFQRRLGFGVSAVLGPEAAYRLSGRISGRYRSAAENRDYDFEYTRDVSRLDLRIKAGFAYRFRIGAHGGEWGWSYAEGLVSGHRPLGYRSESNRNVAWTGTPSAPFVGVATRSQSVESALTFTW